MTIFSKNFKNLPEKEKNKIAFLILILFAIVLFLFFGWILKQRFGSKESIDGLKEDTKVFEGLVNDLSDNFTNLDTQ